MQNGLQLSWEPSFHMHTAVFSPLNSCYGLHICIGEQKKIASFISDQSFLRSFFAAVTVCEDLTEIEFFFTLSRFHFPSENLPPTTTTFTITFPSPPIPQPLLLVQPALFFFFLFVPFGQPGCIYQASRFVCLFMAAAPADPEPQ